MNPNAYFTQPETRYQSVATLVLAVLNPTAMIKFVNSITGANNNTTKVYIVLKKHVGSFDRQILNGGILRGMSKDTDGTVLLHVGPNRSEDSVSIAAMVVESIEILLPVQN